MTHIVLVALAACSSAVVPPSPPEASSPPVEADGLRIHLGLPASLDMPLPPSVTARLELHNVSTHRMVVVMLGAEAFRAGNSSFVVTRDRTVISAQPEPQAHGYSISEADFISLAPGEARTFTQTLDLAQLGTPGVNTVRWHYEWSTRRFPGGQQTLDGIAKPLFGGGDVPDLWVGNLTLEQALTVRAR